MALRSNVEHEDDIVCELYADIRSDVSVYSNREGLNSECDVTTTSSHK
jgi:hypothetical protein